MLQANTTITTPAGDGSEYPVEARPGNESIRNTGFAIVNPSSVYLQHTTISIIPGVHHDASDCYPASVYCCFSYRMQ